MHRRRDSQFWASLVISTCVNLGFFAVLQPVHVAAAKRGARTVHRLTQVRVTQVLPTPTPNAATPNAATPVTVATPAPRVARGVGAGRVSSKGAGGKAPSLPGVRGDWRPGEPAGPKAALGPTGGDGTRTVPTTRLAGGGDPLGAQPFEPGRALQVAAMPALAGVGDLRLPPRASADPTRDGPALIFPGPGHRGGTPTGETLGQAPLAGTAGSGSERRELAPQTVSGFAVPLAPTTDGMLLRDRPGHGLPTLADPTLIAPATPVDPHSRSGGGGGTAPVPGIGGGGPPIKTERDSAQGGGGSGMVMQAERPGGLAVGLGPGGTGGGGNGLAPVGSAGKPDGSRAVLAPVTSSGGPSVIAQPGRGDGDGPAQRPGTRAPGPGGPAVDVDPSSATGTKSPGGGDGSGGTRVADEGGGSGAARRGKGESEVTGVVIDTLGLEWPHYPTSFDLRVGAVDGPVMATIGVHHYRSVASAKASNRVERDGKREVIVIKPLRLEFIAAEGKGARQIAVISAADAKRLKETGLLAERSRILTVWKNNVSTD